MLTQCVVCIQWGGDEVGVYAIPPSSECAFVGSFGGLITCVRKMGKVKG